MPAKTKLKDIVGKGPLLVPFVYDCLSAKVCEMVGYKALILTMNEVSEAQDGTPNLGLFSMDNMVWVTNHVCTMSNLPIIVEAGCGWGITPLNAYRAAQKLVQAGACGIMLDNARNNRYEPGELISREMYIGRVRGAVRAMEGTEGLLFARIYFNSEEELDEAVSIAQEAISEGAYAVVPGTNDLELAQKFADKLDGIVMLHDFHTPLDQPDLNVDKLYDRGFDIVTINFALKAGIDESIIHGRENVKNKNDFYTETHPGVTGYGGPSAMPIFDPAGWAALSADLAKRPPHKSWFRSVLSFPPLEDDGGND